MFCVCYTQPLSIYIKCIEILSIFLLTSSASVEHEFDVVRRRLVEWNLAQDEWKD